MSLPPTDAEEIIDMVSKALFYEQQKQVQENIHHQIKNFCTAMDEILLPDIGQPQESQSNATPPLKHGYAWEGEVPVSDTCRIRTLH
ncbi:hypothetical protein COLO4_20881 [Corchorus olitorius]|uniref:Uncharacterized protein n=1 Tax=Corchorus olitorius TaxID=93759 RepID=A0A1R3IWC9_9ROSI|nr:hypothetical protein COLO4_20881 [Corchorus olitorius]